jgi:LAS superfamily LD-carboxypeptidase LdcB
MSPSRTPRPRIGPEELTGRSRAHVVEAEGAVLQPGAATAFRRMRAAAAREGIELCAASSFRDFNTQARIWNQKWRGERPLLDRRGQPLVAASLAPRARLRALLIWSAPPGASRHHWGSDLDVYDRAALADGQRPQLVPEEYAPGGPFAALTAWLDRHMARFGFYRPYVTDRGGVQPEPWHLSHAPTAREMSRRFRPRTWARALETCEVDGKEALLAALDEVYGRYVRAVDPPPLATPPTRARSVRTKR